MSRLLTDLRPEAQQLVTPFLASCAAAELDVFPTCTLRTLAEQAALYAQGRTAPGPVVTDARPGTSAHNYGLAIDVAIIVNGKLDWSGTSAVWKQVGALGVATGLEWAGTPGFPFVEYAHFQVPNWRVIAQLQSA